MSRADGWGLFLVGGEMMNRFSSSIVASIILTVLLLAVSGVIGCHQPTQWSFTGPRVYLIKGTAAGESDALDRIQQALASREINAAVYTPEDWLKIVVDIDADPDEEAILVGHGHGAFLCTQVVRHYAQHHKTKFIDAVFTIDAFNKDWPHSARQSGDETPREAPTPIPIGHNALKVHNAIQRTADGRIWGTDLVSTRASNVAGEHPYYWYDHYWYDRPITGQRAPAARIGGVLHHTIDNEAELVHRIIDFCRREALSPYHYTPPEHQPDVEKEAPTQSRPQPARRTG